MLHVAEILELTNLSHIQIKAKTKQALVEAIHSMNQNDHGLLYSLTQYSTELVDESVFN